MSEQAAVAFWFEENELKQLVHCEISLNDSEIAELVKTTLLFQEDLQRQLSEGPTSFSYSLNRINTKEGERILAFSVPKKGATQGKRKTIVQANMDAKKAIAKEEENKTENIRKTATTLLKEAEKKVLKRGRASILVNSLD